MDNFNSSRPVVSDLRDAPNSPVSMVSKTDPPLNANSTETSIHESSGPELNILPREKWVDGGVIATLKAPFVQKLAIDEFQVG